MAYGSETPAEDQDALAQPAYDPAALFKEATERFGQGMAWERKNREAAKEDADFLAGNQWHQQDLQARQRDKRPTLTINRLPQFLKQVANEIRKNPPGIQCTLGDGAANPRAALVYEGMIRAIERVSMSNRVYSRAGEQAAGVGMGHFRLVTERENPMRFERGLRFKSIRNPFAVVWDPGATMDDKSDAKWCFVYEEMPEADFKKRYPNTQTAPWAVHKPASNSTDGWKSSGKTVTVAEYWVVKEDEVPIAEVVSPNGETEVIENAEACIVFVTPGGELELLDAPDEAEFNQARELGWAVLGYGLEAAQAAGWTIKQTGMGIKRRVCQYLLGGQGVIEGPNDKDGWSRIPIFTVVGDEFELGDETLRGSLIRFAKDAQRMLNYYVSKDVEMHALAPMVPFVLTRRQIAGLEGMWTTLNQVNRPYVIYNDVDEEGEVNAPRPSREQGVGTNPGLMAGAERAGQYLKDTTGIFDASLGNQSNETSGVAINARDAQSDTGTFNYIDNLLLQVEAAGRELINMIPKTYTTEGQIRIIGRDDAPAIIDLAREGIDLNVGKYDVVVKIGPAFQTQRDEMISEMAELAKGAPPPIAVLLFMEIAKMRDFQGADELAAKMEAVAKFAGLLPPDQPAPMPGMEAMPMGAPPGMAPQGMGGPPMMAPPPMQGAPQNIIPFPPGRPPAPAARVAPRPPIGPQGARGFEGALV